MQGKIWKMELEKDLNMEFCEKIENSITVNRNQLGTEPNPTVTKVVMTKS